MTAGVAAGLAASGTVPAPSAPAVVDPAASPVITATPEPATVALVGAGVLLVGGVARRRRAPNDA